MADSDDSGGIVRSDSVRLLTYEKYVVICNSCSHVLLHSNECFQRMEQWSSFPIDVLTLKFDPIIVSWRCRNCKSILSSNVPDQVIQFYLRSDQCILSHSDTSRRFDTIEMVSSE